MKKELLDKIRQKLIDMLNMSVDGANDALMHYHRTKEVEWANVNKALVGQVMGLTMALSLLQREVYFEVSRTDVKHIFWELYATN